MKNKCASLIPQLVLALMVLKCDLNGQTLVNGSFEVGIDPNTGGGLNVGLFAIDDVTIPGWTVSAGTVDYIGGRWAAGDGSRSLDLSGVSAGTIFQEISGFTPGLRYEVSFLMAGNPEGGQPTKNLEVSIGNASQVFSFNGFGTAFEMGWVQHRLEFTAADRSMTLTFTSLNDDASGAALDGVRIDSVPEPSVLALVVVGTVALAPRRWGSRQSCRGV